MIGNAAPVNPFTPIQSSTGFRPNVECGVGEGMGQSNGPSHSVEGTPANTSFVSKQQSFISFGKHGAGISLEKPAGDGGPWKQPDQMPPALQKYLQVELCLSISRSVEMVRTSSKPLNFLC